MRGDDDEDIGRVGAWALNEEATDDERDGVTGGWRDNEVGDGWERDLSAKGNG